MIDARLHEKLVDYLQDAHAMEQGVLRMLDSMIANSKDPETIERLKEHRLETQRHERMVKDRLDAIGEGRSLVAEAAGMADAMVKGVIDSMRADKPGKNARDAFITEQTEIAAYELLERLADRAGDLETARVAREIRMDEEEMARWISHRWDKFIDLTLEEAGIRSVSTRV